MANIFKEFREFALRGNVLDMGVGILIGAAFGKIVSSFVADVLTPPLGLLLGHMDFRNMFLVIGGGDGRTFLTLAEAREAGATTLNYGMFLNALLDFAFVAVALFFLIRWINRLRKSLETPAPAAPAAPAPSLRACPECLSMIPAAAARCAHCTSPVESGQRG